MIELLHCVEKIEELLNDPDLQGSDLLVKGDRTEEGIGVIEAPRGTLFFTTIASMKTTRSPTAT